MKQRIIAVTVAAILSIAALPALACGSCEKKDDDKSSQSSPQQQQGQGQGQGQGQAQGQLQGQLQGQAQGQGQGQNQNAVGIGMGGAGGSALSGSAADSKSNAAANAGASSNQNQSATSLSGSNSTSNVKTGDVKTGDSTSGAMAGAVSTNNVKNGDSTSKASNSTNVGTSVGTNVGVSTGDTLTAVKTGDVKTGDSKSTSSAAGGAAFAAGGAGGQSNATGGTSLAAGGAGGQSSSTSAGGNSSLSGSGNGGGASVSNNTTNNITDNSRELTFIPMQTAQLPSTIAVGNLKLEAVGACGPRFIVKPFERETHVPQLLGLWNQSVAVQTMHGMIEGPDTEKPFVIVEAELPAPFNTKIVKAIGHRLYVTAGSDGQGGGSSGALNFASDRAMAAGAALNANSSYGVVGVVAVDCEFEAVKASVPEAPKVKTADFVVGKRQYTGPYTPKETDMCPKTLPNGNVVYVKKTSPDQKCGSRLMTEKAVVDIINPPMPVK